MTVFQDCCAMMMLDRTRTEQFFYVTIGNTGRVRMLAIKLTVI